MSARGLSQEGRPLTTLVRREAEVIPLHPVARPIPRDVEETVRMLLASLDDMKAEQIVEIDIRGKSSIADVMLIATGRVARHVAAIADRLAKDLRDAGHHGVRIEGTPVCDWVLIDTGDVIVHIFRPEVRLFYNLEKMWSSGRPNEIRPS
ncbi:ribosome silencing factor [Labrys wisconsinensis]|uniref:Ribosomal silencing factor RsfS n=1 Tax=Labrys wisconsinensis TaxID=425677 RepID=A0ABU0J4W9_9HYPH|nr:ribosome silencing factor [Labrys wisconsinensis]MDQ0468227.1 ribosome-associated protein [Labrys wisconsinensis]